MATGDKALVRRTLDGDREAFGDLVERYSALVRGIVYEKVRRLDEVEDLVQEVFCRAYEDLSRLHEPGRFAPWLGRIAANIALDWLRRRQIRDRSRQSGQLLTLAPRTTQPDEIFEESENSGILWEALDSLSPDYRRIVVLYHIEGCSQPEISRFLGLTVPVVRWRLRKARQKLGAELRQMIFRKADQQPGVRLRVRDKVLTALPLAPFFRMEPQVGWMARWGWHLGLTLGLAGLAGLVGMKGEAVREIWHLEPERMTEMKMSGFRIRRAEVELPETSVLWEPHKPKAGETVRIEAVGGLEGERVELHYITDPWEARDRVVQMERQGELLVAEIELPAEANAVFFYASAGEEEQMQSLGPLSHRNLSPTDRKILRRYRHSFPVYGVDGKPVQDAEVCRAQMANFQGEPLEEVLSHLDRELAFHPEHFSIYATRWRFMLGEGAAAGAEEKVRAEQAALIARFPDRPEPLRVAGTWISGDLAYQEELSGDLYRRFPESREAKQAGLLILNQLFFAREHGKLAGAARDFIDRFPESAEIDLAYWYRLIGLGQVDAREAALLADSLMAGTTALHVDPERERSRSRSPMPIGGFLAGGLAYSLHFDLLSAEGDSTAALTLARRLIASGMQDPLPYLHIGERLAHVETWSLMSLREGLKEQAGTSYPRDLPLSIDLLEAGLQMTEPEKMFRLPNFNLYEDEDAPGAAERRRSCLASIARFRRQFLQPLGRCYFTQGEYRRAAAYLEEAAALQEQNSEYDHTRLDDAVYLLLGEVYEKMEDWRSAEAAYLRIIRLLHSHLQAEDALARVHGKLHGHLRGVRPLLETCYPEAPDFRVTGADGRPVRLSELRDKVVLVYYTLMPPAEFDEISAFLEDWAGQFAQKGLEVLFISGRKMVEIDPQERSFQIAVDDEGLREQYSIAYRSLFLIDRQGRLRLRQELHGRIRSEQETQVMRKIRELVAEKGSADGRLTSGEIER